MALTLTSLADLPRLRLDALIDARSPAEFAEDRLPGAVNLPVLDDAERARIGTVYLQESRFLARRLGAALVARNVARHLEGWLADKPAAWRPMIYCWRGGMRSGSFATILRAVGWPVETLDGGYRSWRRLVVRTLYDGPLPCRLVLLDGDTGTAKTELLARIAARGGQILDLEGLAAHRGSIFGGRPGGQPTQKAFESGLAAALAALEPARPVLVEAESARVGNLTLPPALWRAMHAAPRVAVIAPRAARAAYAARAYADLIADRGRLAAAIDRLRPFHARERVAGWQALARAGDFAALAEALMAEHYDPRYAKARATAPPAATLRTDSLDGPALDRLATALIGMLDAPRPSEAEEDRGIAAAPGRRPAPPPAARCGRDDLGRS